MATHRKLPPREAVFLASLLLHGFRVVRHEMHIKRKYGYIRPATRKEDAGGTDFWIKMPKEDEFFPVQITQRGTKLCHKYHDISGDKLEEFANQSEERLRKKRKRCKKHRIAFVLVRDFDGDSTNPDLALGDAKSLRYAIKILKRLL